MPLRRRSLPPVAALLVAFTLALSGCSAEEVLPGDAGSAAGGDSPRAGADGAARGERSTAGAAPLGLRIRSTFFGMHDGRVGAGIAPPAPVGALRFWDAGTSWIHVEPAPNEFSWSGLDTAVATAEANGARPLLVLGQTPNFYASQPDQVAAYGPGANSMPDLGAWRRYVAAVAERYGSRIDYQVWNEANISGYWAGTPAQMARLTVEAGRTIHRAVPDATVVGPAFALRLPTQRQYFQEFWSLQSRRSDLERAVDAVAVHLYPPAEGLPEAQVELLEGARDVLARNGVDRPVWNTEVNFGMLGGSEPPTIPPERQRAFLLRAYLVNAGLGVERVYWYRWDIGRIANTYLTEPDLLTETLAGDAFDVLRDWLGATTVSGCGPSNLQPGLWSCTATKGDQRRTFWWKPRGPATELESVDADAWVRADGTVTACAENATCSVPVGSAPVMLLSRR